MRSISNICCLAFYFFCFFFNFLFLRKQWKYVQGEYLLVKFYEKINKIFLLIFLFLFYVKCKIFKYFFMFTLLLLLLLLLLLYNISLFFFEYNFSFCLLLISAELSWTDVFFFVVRVLSSLLSYTLANNGSSSSNNNLHRNKFIFVFILFHI